MKIHSLHLHKGRQRCPAKWNAQSPESDFQTRSKAAGSIVCNGFRPFFRLRQQFGYFLNCYRLSLNDPKRPGVRCCLPGTAKCIRAAQRGIESGCQDFLAAILFASILSISILRFSSGLILEERTETICCVSSLENWIPLLRASTWMEANAAMSWDFGFWEISRASSLRKFSFSGGKPESLGSLDQSDCNIGRHTPFCRLFSIVFWPVWARGLRGRQCAGESGPMVCPAHGVLSEGRRPRLCLDSHFCQRASGCMVWIISWMFSSVSIISRSLGPA